MRHIFLLLIITPYLHGQILNTHNIKIDQIGYRPNDKKIAVISDPQIGYNASESYTPGSTLDVFNITTNTIVFSGTPVAWNGGITHTQSGDKVWWLDFSSVTTSGTYVIHDAANNTQSFPFVIANDVYKHALYYALRTYYYQRCGTAKTALHAGNDYTDVACHVGALQDLNCRSVSNPVQATERDLSGGWHDAGDYNKYTNFTFVPIHFLLDSYEQYPFAFGDTNNIPESGNGTPDILDEIKYELDWLLKMQNADGSVIMKISTNGFNGGSPPSTHASQRFYSAAASSAVRTACSIFAHASIVFKQLSDTAMQTFADTLLERAKLGWQWLSANTAYSNYNNETFSSANPEISTYEQDARKFVAAVYLYAATGDSIYKTYVDNNYSAIQPIQWTYWYPFEAIHQDALLYYTKQQGATVSVVNAILSNCITSVSTNNTNLLPAWTSGDDAYLAFMNDQDYVWGSNEFKCETGCIYGNMLYYNLDPGNQNDYRDAQAGYVHYIHGVNPNSYCYLSNSWFFGADRSIYQIYHDWFGDGTMYDSIANYIGPPPGYLTCGVNPNYSPDASYTGPPISPPQNQPIQKSYKDWNTDWPENSWEITEVTIYNQAAYIKLISAFIDTSAIVTSLTELPDGNGWSVISNPTDDYLTVTGSTGNTASLTVRDISGRIVLQRNVMNGDLIPLAYLSTGVYIITLHSDSEQITSKKIIVGY